MWFEIELKLNKPYQSSQSVHLRHLRYDTIKSTIFLLSVHDGVLVMKARDVLSLDANPAVCVSVTVMKEITCCRIIDYTIAYQCMTNELKLLISCTTSSLLNKQYSFITNQKNYYL